jgi:hypothetical protein
MALGPYDTKGHPIQSDSLVSALYFVAVGTASHCKAISNLVTKVTCKFDGDVGTAAQHDWKNSSAANVDNQLVMDLNPVGLFIHKSLFIQQQVFYQS